MDTVTTENQKRWNRLVFSGVPCSRPTIKLTPKEARKMLDAHGIFGDLTGKKVLCLASGGGQQSIGFAILGAEVTVVDFSEEQLEKDRIAAKTIGKEVRVVPADMRDLSALKSDYFDVVYQPYSINYVREINTVFDEVRRVMKPTGIYFLMFHNPSVHGSWKDGCWGSRWQKKELWNGVGYPLRLPYQEGFPVTTVDPHWNFTGPDGKTVQIPAPQEFKHTLSTIINGLIERDFRILRFEEYKQDPNDKPPGTWEHYVSFAAPWFYLWAVKGKESASS